MLVSHTWQPIDIQGSKSSLGRPMNGSTTSTIYGTLSRGWKRAVHQQKCRADGLVPSHSQSPLVLCCNMQWWWLPACSKKSGCLFFVTLPMNTAGSLETDSMLVSTPLTPDRTASPGLGWKVIQGFQDSAGHCSRQKASEGPCKGNRTAVHVDSTFQSSSFTDGTGTHYLLTSSFHSKQVIEGIHTGELESVCTLPVHQIRAQKKIVQHGGDAGKATSCCSGPQPQCAQGAIKDQRLTAKIQATLLQISKGLCGQTKEPTTLFKLLATTKKFQWNFLLQPTGGSTQDIDYSAGWNGVGWGGVDWSRMGWGGVG